MEVPCGAWHGPAWLGKAWPGGAGPGEARFHFFSAWRVAARVGKAGSGVARPVTAGPGGAGPGMVRYGVSGHGKARLLTQHKHTT